MATSATAHQSHGALAVPCTTSLQLTRADPESAR
jgi:hypothetical protein